MVLILLLIYWIVSTNSFGKTTFPSFIAWANKGAISPIVKPAMPQPTFVTRNVYSGCCEANSMNWSTYILPDCFQIQIFHFPQDE